MSRKKKVLILTDHPLAKTGFGRSARALLEYLYLTDKYELVNLAVGAVNSPDLSRTPWKTLPTVFPQQLEEITKQNDPRAWETIDRMAGYGAYAVDSAVKSEKPDVFIAVQDIWGIDFCAEKTWFPKITSALWTTLDSRPILPKAVEIASKIKHFWSWADFATQDLHKMGHKHVKTLRGALATELFYRLSEENRKNLRKQHNIDENVWVIGFVFRNQLRKSVPNLLQGYKIFIDRNPQIKTKLLLHTNWTEGWDIPKLLDENGIKKENILTTFVCRACKKYEIKSPLATEQDCHHCKTAKSQITTHPSFGISEKELNEVYNLMDVYCHPFTSGGQEISVQEAKLAELITLVTNYSCGEDLCLEESGSLPLEWSEYREPGTQFIKASTYPSSIAKQLEKVLKLKPQNKRELEKKSRQWVIDNFATEKIGKQLEEFIDGAPFANDDCFTEPVSAKNPEAVIPETKDDGDWLIYMYHNILKMPIGKDDPGFLHWMARIKEGVPRIEIEKFFRHTATVENQKNQVAPLTFDCLLNKEDKGRVLIVLPESAGDIFLVTSLFKSIKDRYPDWTLYVATKPQFKDILTANPFVDKWLDYHPMMENLTWLEGNSSHNGYFNVAYLAHTTSQRYINHYHNGIDKIDFSVRKS